MYLRRREMQRHCHDPRNHTCSRSRLTPSLSFWQICESFCAFQGGQTVDIQSSAKPNTVWKQMLGFNWPHTGLNGLIVLYYDFWQMKCLLFHLPTTRASNPLSKKNVKWKTTLPNTLTQSINQAETISGNHKCRLDWSHFSSHGNSWDIFNFMHSTETILKTFV